MNIDTRVQFGILIVTTMSLGWSIGYYSRSDRIETCEKQLSSYTQADKLNLSNTLHEIDQVNKVIAENISDIRSHYEWRNDKDKLLGDVSTLKEQIKEKDENLSKAKKVIDDLTTTVQEKQKEVDGFYPTNEEFWVDQNTTKGLSGYDVVIGLLEVNYDKVVIIYENHDAKLNVGNYLEKTLKDSKCKIILQEIRYTGSPSGAKFKMVCTKTPEKSPNK